MGIISRTGDLFYAFRFLKLLVTPWEKTTAFGLEIIDKDGKVIKKSAERTTAEQKSAYTIFHRLVFNVKRLLNKLPFGKSKLASYASALFLIKEHTDLNDEDIRKILNDAFSDLEETIDLSESTQWFERDGKLSPGSYTLVNDIASKDTGDTIALAKTKVKLLDFTEAYGNIFGLNVYQVEHVLTKQKILVTSMDLKK